ncbi:MAG: small ribosomal subunit Rsm22 family protein [Sandaracinaceae bacterium]
MAALAPRLLGRHDRRGDALVRELRGLSDLYNLERGGLERASDAPAARLRFFFLRDLPKVEGPLAELAVARALPAGPVWRVLDVGAGYGATSLGAATYAARLDGVERVDVDAVDRDGPALEGLRALARLAGRDGLAPVSRPVDLVTEERELEGLEAGVLRPADLVLVGFVLNELHRELDAEARHAARAHWLTGLARRLRPGGSLIVLEPAHRAATRDLMAVRDRLVEAGEVTVFAPCLRTGSCPLLGRDRDWCHDQLDLALPPPLADLARAASLRRERLTYAYLTLRRDDVRLGPALGGETPDLLRVVGGPLPSKGKVEWDGCGPTGRVRLRRLDREASEQNAGIEGAARGTVLRAQGAFEDGGQLRLRPGQAVRRVLR